MGRIKNSDNDLKRKDIGKAESSDLEIISIETREEWREWLEHNFNYLKGVWLRIYKKDSGIPSVYHEEALDEALCYGWIDGQGRRYDDDSYLQKFTQRRKRSLWSKRNVEKVERLEKEGRIRPSGLKEIEAAKKDGRWDRAYDSPANMTIPEDLLVDLSKDRKAMAFLETLNKANRYAITWRLQTAKNAEIRDKRKRIIIEMLSREEKFHD